MEEERFEKYISQNFDTLMQGFIDLKQDEFEEYCYERFKSYDPSDDAYDRWKDRQAEEEYEKQKEKGD